MNGLTVLSLNKEHINQIWIKVACNSNNAFCFPYFALDVTVTVASKECRPTHACNKARCNDKMI